MSVISVTGIEIPDGARLRWKTITPWVGQRFQTHIPIPGGDGIGVTFDRGSDNRVATLSGLVLWNAYGEAVLDALGGALLTVDNGAGSSAVRCRAGSITILEAKGAIVRFSLPLTEEPDGGDA